MSIRFRWALFFIALFSHAALVVTGQMPVLPFLIVPITLWGYVRLLRGRPSASRVVLNAAALATLIYFLLDMTVISGDLLVAVGTLTLAFHAIKSFDIRNPADGLQVFFMSVIQLVVASELEQPIEFAIIFLLFIGSSILFTMTAHQSTVVKRMPSGLIVHALKLTLIAIPVVAVLFLFLPRTSGGLFGNRNTRQAASGFDDKVSIGTFEEVIADNSVVMRITLPDGNSGDPYWRGKVFETYEDNTWVNHWKRGFPYFNRNREIQFPKKTPETSILQDILLVPPKSGIIFGLSEVFWIACDSRWVVQYPNGNIAVSHRQKKRIRYQVRSTGKRPPVMRRTLDMYLQMPGGLTRLSQLARSLTENIPEPARKCRAIEQWLITNCRYSLQVPQVNDGSHPIEHFLFTGRQGYCEYYATAMTLMLRAIDIPARIVAGYYGGDYNPFGDYTIIRQAHAHTWVEAAIGNQWNRYDPTPPVENLGTNWFMAYMDMLGFAWDRYVVGFTVDDRESLFSKISLPFKPGNPDAEKPRQIIFLFVLFIIITGTGRVLYQAWKRPRKNRPTHPAGKVAAAMYRLLNQRYPHQFANGWRAGLNRIKPADPHLREQLDRFFRLYEETRFGPETTTTATVHRLKALLKDIRKIIASRKRSKQ